MFPHISLSKICDPWGGAFFWPKGHNLNKIGRRLPVDATYHVSKIVSMISKYHNHKLQTNP